MLKRISLFVLPRLVVGVVTSPAEVMQGEQLAATAVATHGEPANNIASQETVYV